MYVTFSVAMIKPYSDMEFMLPLDDSEIKNKYNNVIILKELRIIVYILLNIIWSYFVYGREYFNTFIPHSGIEYLYVVLHILMLLVFALYAMAIDINDSFAYRKRERFYQKGMTRIIGSLGQLFFFGAFTSYMIKINSSKKSFSKTEICIELMAIVCMLISAIASMRNDKIVDY